MTNENQKLLVNVPFSGFYNSIHDEKLIDLLEETLRDDHGDISFPNIFRELHNAMNWEVAQNQYADSWVAHLRIEFDIEGMEFDRLESPREYNFSTDRVFAKIPIEQVKRIDAEVDRTELAELVKERLAPRSGFMPFYSNDVDDWPIDIADWDHNRLSLLLECWLTRNGDEMQELEMGFVDGDSEWDSFLDSVAEHSPGLPLLLDQAYKARNISNCRKVDCETHGCYIVSDGTMNPVHIIPKCIAVLKSHDHWMAWSLSREIEQVADLSDPDFDEWLYNILHDEIHEYMQHLAPEGFIFGVNEGDGACLGYWPIDGEVA